jgi:mannose-6-phosphate isomerase-like protein (cupin superfamily)
LTLLALPGISTGKPFRIFRNNVNDREFKNWLYRRAIAEARGFGLVVLEEYSSSERPWGAYLRIAEESLECFYNAYWQGVEVPGVRKGLKLDPKILLVAPGARLSLQYHHRRSEHWRVLDCAVKVVMGNDADSLEEKVFKAGDVLRLPCGTWHRLAGMGSWGRIAEIWEHVDMENPSDEMDIVRVQDDYGR